MEAVELATLTADASCAGVGGTVHEVCVVGALGGKPVIEPSLRVVY
jgi:hypothetical protein